MSPVALLFVAAVAGSGGTGEAGTPASPRVALETSKGKIVLELDVARAPKTVENFLAYVRAGHYDGTIFHRVIDGFMVQGGGYDTKLERKATRAPIQNEAANGLKNTRGTVATSTGGCSATSTRTATASRASSAAALPGTRPRVSAAAARPADRERAGMLGMPGMVDTHRHMWQTAMRGYGADWTLTQYFVWYYLQFGKLFRPEDIYAGNYLAAIEAIDAGVTTSVDWSHGLQTT